MNISEEDTRWFAIIGATLYFHLNSGCLFGGYCGGQENPPDLASLIIAVAVSTAVASEDRWSLISSDENNRPQQCFVTLCEVLLSIALVCAILMYVWYPIVPYLCNISDLFTIFGMDCFGQFLTTNEGVEHLKIMVALLLLAGEYYVLEQRRQAMLFGNQGQSMMSQTMYCPMVDKQTCWDEYCEDEGTITDEDTQSVETNNSI